MTSSFKMLADAFRLAFFRPVPAERLARGWGAVSAAALLTLMVPALPALWTNGPNGEWNWFTLPSAVFHIPLVIFAAIATAHALGRKEEVARLAFAGFLAALAIDIAAVAFSLAAADVPSYQRMTTRFGWVPGTWLALAMAAHAGRSIGRGERRVGIVAACMVLIALPLANVYRDRSLWHAPYVPDEDTPANAQRMGVAGEDAFYRQPALLAQELQAVQPGRKGLVDVFFIGMAGFGPQDVFMKEVNAVARLFRERFGAEGHVIRLVNNPKTLRELPIASRTSLRESLRRMAEVMDRDEDVLVLFVTSHGSDDHSLSLTLWPMRLHQIDPATLRSLLDEAGIRNRVVIVSACYSGGFVKALEETNTLVITASAVDKTSFGCTSEAEWTYFGRAYFDQALRATRSFAQAFEIAKLAVTAREKLERFDPSEPQMSMGAAIGERLARLAAELEGASAR